MDRESKREILLLALATIIFEVPFVAIATPGHFDPAR